MVTLLRDHVVLTGQPSFGALAAASHPPRLTYYAIPLAGPSQLAP